MIINRAPARGGRGGAGRGLERSERGGRARPRDSSKPGGLLGGSGQAGVNGKLRANESSRAHSALLSTPTPNPTGRSNLSTWPARLSSRAPGSAHPGSVGPQPQAREGRLCPRRRTSQLSAPSSHRCRRVPVNTEPGTEAVRAASKASDDNNDIYGGRCACQELCRGSNALISRCRRDAPPT